MTQVEEHMRSAHDIVAGLPRGPYTDYYQPAYPNSGELVAAVHELQASEAVTRPPYVDQLRGQLSLLATCQIDRPIIITGRCAEEVDLQTPVEDIIEEYRAARELVVSAVAGALCVTRGMGQSAKPRSQEHQTLSDGSRVLSYMGGAVNGHSFTQRQPDPRRLVATAAQARDVAAGLAEATGEHHPAAHEALLLAYEHSYVRVDPETGKKYLLSADLPWIGKRTNQLDGPHVALLADVENPVGIKIGADSTAEHIAGLQRALNRNNEPGKLIFMLRLGLQEGEALEAITAAIAAHAPGALIMYDIHGTTRPGPDGQKIRYTGDIIANIKATAAACRKAGLKLHGVHLETIMDPTRNECVDEAHNIPRDAPHVDPLLNPQQTEYILRATAADLL